MERLMKKYIKLLLNKIFYKAFPEINNIHCEINKLNENYTELLNYALQADKEYFNFLNIKKITNGYLAPEVYREIYRCACSAKEGYIIDIGPAQGGSSISLCLGLRDSSKIKSKVISIEKGEGSAALISNDKNVNETKLAENIKAYDVEKYSIVLMGDVAEVADNVPGDLPVTCIFIDADGALDRDFKLFYNRMLDNSYIIIDDYTNIINYYALNNYLKWSTQEEMDVYVKSKGASSFVDLCPLGKEYTTYKFINYFLESGLIVQDKIIGQTFFGRKNNGFSFNQKHYENLQTIRSNILDEYYEKNKLLKKLHK